MENVVSVRSAAMRERIAMYNANALKIGIFGANCSSGRSATKVPERWSASWPDCRRLARMADAAGIDFMLPIGRWKGYGGDTDFHGSTLETITWAVGLLSATERMNVTRSGSPADATTCPLRTATAWTRCADSTVSPRSTVTLIGSAMRTRL